MPLTRKFSLNLTPIRTSLGLNKPDKSKQSGSQSSSFRPPSPTIDRQVLPAQVEAELRNTLIKALRDINDSSPPGSDDMLWKRRSSRLAADGQSGVEKSKHAERSKHQKKPSLTIPEVQEESAETANKKYDSGVGVDLERVASRSSASREDPQQRPNTGQNAPPVASAGTSTLTSSAGMTRASTAVTSGAAIQGQKNALDFGFSQFAERSTATDASGAPNWSTLRGPPVVNPAPPSSAQRPSSAVPLSPAVEEPLSTKTSSKRRNTVVQGTAHVLDKLASLRQENVVKSAPSSETKPSWWRRASISAKKSTASLRMNKSAGDTPNSRSNVLSSTPKPVAPPLPRLDSARWQEKEAEKKAEEEISQKSERETVQPSEGEVAKPPELKLDTADLIDPSQIPLPKSPLPDSPAAHAPSDEIQRRGSAVTASGDGEERTLSPSEDRKSNSGLQITVNSGLRIGSLHSNTSTPLLSAASKKSMEFPRPGSKQSARSATHSAAADDSPVALAKVDSLLSPELEKEISVTPLAIPRESLEPKVDSKLSSPVSTTAPKTTFTLVPKIDTTQASVAVPKTNVEAATPVTPAIEELEHPYSPNKLSAPKTNDTPPKRQLQARASGILKRLSSIGSPAPSKRDKFSPVLAPAPSAQELRTQRAARMKAYSKVLEQEFLPVDSKKIKDAADGDSQAVKLSERKSGRSASPTPSDLYAL